MSEKHSEQRSNRRSSEAPDILSGGVESDLLSIVGCVLSKVIPMFRIRTLTISQGIKWLSCGVRFWAKRPLEATLPAAVFMLLAGLLRFIPVIGDVLLLLIVPSVVSSYLIHVHTLSAVKAKPRGPADASTGLKRQVENIRRALFGSWLKPENIFPLALIGFVLVFLGVITYGLYTFIGGQGVVSPLSFYELTGQQMVRVTMAHAVASLIWWIISALLFWALPLFALREVPLVNALQLNLLALRQNAKPLAVYLLILACGFLPAALLSMQSRVAGHLLFWVSGTGLASLFGFSAYCSFRLVFADPVVAAPQSVPHPPASRRAS